MLKVTNLSKDYGNKLAVNNISFEINSGEVVGFLGRNGAGKSTTMNMITGYLSATDGSISVNEFDVLDESIKAKACIGYLPEIPPVYSDLTVWENLSFIYNLKKVKEDKNTHLGRICSRVKIYDVKDRLCGNLSKGYRQRVGIAMALVGDPEILIFDEPTVGLDPNQIIEIRQLILELAETRTVILSSHILSEIEAVCKRIIIIHNGDLIADDSPEALINKVSDGAITLKLAGDKAAIETALGKIPSVAISSIEEAEENTFAISISATNDISYELSQMILDNKFAVYQLQHNKFTLEDAFIKLTSQAEAEALARKEAEAREAEAEHDRRRLGKKAGKEEALEEAAIKEETKEDK